MQHGTQTTEEIRVDELAGFFPLEVLVVKRVVRVE